MAPGYGAFVTEAVGFRLTADIVALICFIFAALYFVLAGGPEAFKATCKKRQTAIKEGSNDFIRQLGASRDDIDDKLSARSRRSSSFHMLGPTSPNVSRMRMEKTSEEFELRKWGLQGQGGQGLEASLSRERSSQRKRRLYSDIDGTPSPSRFTNLNNSINSPTKMRTGGGSFIVHACEKP